MCSSTPNDTSAHPAASPLDSFRRSLPWDDAKITEREARYRDVLGSLDVGFCIIEVLFDATGRAVDYRFLEANPAFERHTGLVGAVGRTIQEFVPDLDAHWFETYGRVARTGEPVRLEERAEAMGRWFDVYALRVGMPEEHSVAVLFTDVSDRKRAEAERELLLTETRDRAEREALLNRIGEAVRAPLNPDEVLRAAVEALGEALHADRCYFVAYDQERDHGKIGPDWYRDGAGLVSIAGDYRMSDYAVNREAGYRRGSTQIIEDVHEHSVVTSSSTDYLPAPVSLMDALGLRSLVRVPLMLNGTMTALAVAMSDQPRRWTENEVRLVEIVAAQTRAAVESARVQQRERNIAQQLQEALQPPLPNNLPGLALESFYKPALAEAGVGGDFYDVFPVATGCMAMIVGDLSGKGLAAASEVATVRNMVRYALYSRDSLAESISDLHNILVERNLLSGFATVFVGMYDDVQKTFTYVNCGQEPGLIWRAATGTVEYLRPTGPVLGGFGGSFTAVTIPLSTGDVVALFTDGLTDVGPNRRNLLGVEGVARLLQACCAAPENKCGLLECLTAGVDTFGNGRTSDDIALLVGVVHAGSNVIGKGRGQSR